MRPKRAARIRKWLVIPTRNSTVAGRIRRQPGRERRTVARTHPLDRQRLVIDVAGDESGNQALNAAESSVQVAIPSRSARLAFVGSAEALASVTEDSVLHLAAA